MEQNYTFSNQPTNHPQHLCHYRYSLVEERNSSALQTYVQEGDNRNARLHAQIVANRLNSLNKTREDTKHVLRQKIRRAMLWSLKDLPIRDEVRLLRLIR